MQPPDLAPSSTALYDALLSATQSSALVSTASTTTASLIFGIATAAASAAPSSVLSSALPSSSTASSMNDSGDENNGECKLLGPFAILVQGALGALALLSLVYKRWRERPQRPLKVWTFDVSKQVVGSILLHLANLLMSMISSGQIEKALAQTATSTFGAEGTDSYQPNPCSWYLLNLAVDTTLGIPILIGILKVLTLAASYTCLANPVESIESGHYGTPPKASWWLKQCLIYFVGLLGMKACVFFIFQLCPWLGRVGDWALKWTEGNEAVQIAFVMFIFPLIMNALQYYIIDTFIKQKIRADDEADEGTERDEQEEHGGLLGEEGPGYGPSIDEDEVCKGVDRVSKPELTLRTTSSYDPDKDGEVLDGSHGRHGESSSLTDHAAEEAVDNRPRV